MEKRVLQIGIGVFCVLFVVLATSCAFSVTKPAVVVVGFDITVPGLQYEETLPAAVTDLMIDALINSNRFRVFERRKLEAILTERGFQYYSGLVDPSTAVQLGRMIGAHFVVTGSITGLTEGGEGGVSLGFIVVGEKSSSITLTVRVVDVATGEILYSEVKRKKAKGSTVGLALGPIGAYSQQSQDILKAASAACKDIVASLVERMDQRLAELAALPLEGYVVQVKGDTLYLNLGSDSGLVAGSVIRIYHPGEPIVDPKTGEVLEQELVLVAEGLVSRVKDRLSEAVILRKRGDVFPEDIVKVVEGKPSEALSLREEEFPTPAIPEEEETPAPLLAAREEETRPEEEPRPTPEETPPPTVPKEEVPAEGPLPEEAVFEGRTVQYYREFYPRGGGLKVEYTYYLEGDTKVEHGTFTEYYENGQIMIQGTYRDGKKEGFWKEYLRNGVPKAEGTYQNDKKEGLWIIYYPGGKKHFEGMYRNGERDGEWIEYAGDGSVFARIVYKNGKVVSEKKEE